MRFKFRKQSATEFVSRNEPPIPKNKVHWNWIGRIILPAGMEIIPKAMPWRTQGTDLWDVSVKFPPRVCWDNNSWSI